MKKKNFIYLAVPYSHKDPKVREERFKKANAVASDLIKRGNLVFSPISHSHPIAQEGALPIDWSFWKVFDYKLLSICDELIVYCLDGWEESTGVQREIELAEAMELRISYTQDLDPELQQKYEEMCPSPIEYFIHCDECQYEETTSFGVRENCPVCKSKLIRVTTKNEKD